MREQIVLGAMYKVKENKIIDEYEIKKWKVNNIWKR